MGEVRATIQVSNTLAPDTPAIELDCLVDTGAVMTLVPKDVLDKLGIPIIGRAVATLANEESEEMDVAGPLTIRLGDRVMFGTCLVGKMLGEPLVGQLVLESMDLVVDCPHRALGPRPESPAYPSYKLK